MRTPPGNPEAERAVLGSILLDAVGRNEDRVWDICQSEGISADAFFDARNRIIYDAIREMTMASKPIDSLTLLEKLRVEGQLEAVGGIGYIESLVDHTPTTAHAEYYIGIIKEKYLRRRLINTANVTIARSYDEQNFPDPRVVLGEAEKSFLEIGENNDSVMPWPEAVKLSFKRIDRMFNNNGNNVEGLSTGLKYLDEKLLGLKPAEMIVIAARPSVGKTSLAMNIAECCALGRGMNDMPTKFDNGKKHPVLIFSLEMPIEALTKRMIAGRARVDMWRLSRGLCTRNEREDMYHNLTTVADQLSSAPIFVDDTASLDVMDLRSRARRMKKSHNIELIVIDYLQLCRCSEGARQSRVIEVSMISQQLKAMAKELRVPVIVLSQLSRANEQRGDKNERPKLSDLRDSGAIEQDADVVFLLRRPSRTPGAKGCEDANLAIIDVAKNRNGETGEVEVDFISKFTRFGDRIPVGSGVTNVNSSEPPPEGHEYSQNPMT